MKKQKYIIHLIGNGHLDSAWMWPWNEAYTETMGLTETALNGMKIFPQFTFVRSSAQFYEWVKECEPDFFVEIKKRVKEGRWDIVGGMWEQPDLNIPSAESLIRQLIYGQRFFMKYFGKRIKVGYSVDSFGHPAGLPTILNSAGIKAYVFRHPTQELRPDIKSYINWIAPDGSSVIGIHINNYAVWDKDMCKTLIQCINKKSDIVKHIVFMYGWGDHGGGPSIENVKQLIAIKSGNDNEAIKNGADKDKLLELKNLMNEIGIQKIEFSSYSKLYNILKKYQQQLPVIKGHLLPVYQGTYSSISTIKQLIRRLESELFTAESLIITAQKLGFKLPLSSIQHELDESWKSLLFNQFHDLAAGVAYIKAVEDCIQHLQYGRYIVQKIINRIAQKIFRKIYSQKYEFVTFVYNPLPWDVKISLNLRWAPTVFDESGNKIPFQLIPSENEIGPNPGRAMVVTVLPACGGKLFYNSREFFVSPKAPGDELKSSGPLSEILVRLIKTTDINVIDPVIATEIKRDNNDIDKAIKRMNRSKKYWIENKFLYVEFDSKGNLMKIVHKKSGKNLLKGPIEPVLIKDDDTAYGTDAGHEPLNKKYNKFVAKFNPEIVGFIEKGHLRCTFVPNYKWKNSVIRIEWSLSHGLNYIDALVDVNWHDRHTMVKLCIPTNLKEAVAVCDTAVAPVEAGLDGYEELCHKWIDLSGKINDKKLGLAVANDSKYGCSFIGNVMYLTLLRSACLGHQYGPKPSPQKASRYYMDQGVHYFRIRIIPHENTWCESQVQRLAIELNTPPVLIHGGKHNGTISADFSMVEVQPDNIVVFAIKPAYQGSGTVLRLWESSGKQTIAKIRFGKLNTSIRFNKYQLKTIIVEQKNGKLITTETDSLERKLN